MLLCRLDLFYSPNISLCFDHTHRGERDLYLLRRRPHGHLHVVPLAGLPTQVIDHVHKANAARRRSSPPARGEPPRAAALAVDGRGVRRRLLIASALPQWHADGSRQARGVRSGLTAAEQTQSHPCKHSCQQRRRLHGDARLSCIFGMFGFDFTARHSVCSGTAEIRWR